MQFLSYGVVVVFNATFNNISVLSWWSVSLVEETGGPKKTSDLALVTDKLYHIMLYRVYLGFSYEEVIPYDINMYLRKYYQSLRTKCWPDLFVILHLPTISSHVMRLSNTMTGVINLF